MTTDTADGAWRSATTSPRRELTDPSSRSFRELVREAIATHPDVSSQLLAELSWSISDADQLLEYLQRCVDLARSTVGGTTSAAITVTVGRAPVTAVATDPSAREVVEQEYLVGGGPCSHAMRTREAVLADLATMTTRWPEVAEAAAAAGIAMVLASPVGTDEVCLGALNLHTTDPAGFDLDDAIVLQLLCRLAERSICDYSRLRAANDLAGQLRDALANRAPIEQAKGILMAAHQIDADEAFTRLTVQSQTTNTKLRDVARDFLAEHTGAPTA